MNLGGFQPLFAQKMIESLGVVEDIYFVNRQNGNHVILMLGSLLKSVFSLAVSVCVTGFEELLYLGFC